MSLSYRSFSDLFRDVRRLSRTLPKDIDLVVGVPRSGMLPANLLSLLKNIPFVDIQGFCDGRVFETGPRGKLGAMEGGRRLIKKVLVIDDSVCSGSAMLAARERVQAAQVSQETLYAAVYVAPGSPACVDFYVECVPLPRVFAWNVLHHGILANSCVDIDGVLCRDPTEGENDDGRAYQEFLENVEPLYLPTCKIGYLVTCRLEKYRRETLAWLERHGVRFGKLFMMDFPNKAARVEAASHGLFKANVYTETEASLFVESAYRQAVTIAQESRKVVFCTETWDMHHPKPFARFVRDDFWGAANYVYRHPKRSGRALIRKIRAAGI